MGDPDHEPRFGAAVTVEFGSRPSAARRAAAPRAVVTAMGGRIDR